MGVGRFSRALRGVGVLAMPDGGLDKTLCIVSVCEVSPGAGVLRLLVPGKAVGGMFDRRCVADGVLSATREMFSNAEAAEF